MKVPKRGTSSKLYIHVVTVAFPLVVPDYPFIDESIREEEQLHGWVACCLSWRGLLTFTENLNSSEISFLCKYIGKYAWELSKHGNIQPFPISFLYK